ncbi:MAG: hypothetical protein PHE54_03575 [Bacilli bacterium]|nr:hypothetical protein [Bacilli bacterium]
MNQYVTQEDIYFKDIFTQNDDEIDIEANNLNINCLTSRNNNFSLDSAGNLSVSSITSTNPISLNVNYEELFDLIYPVGSLYLSVTNTNPSLVFGGEWEAFGSGRTLVGVDEEQTEFAEVLHVGGNKEMQEHTHTASTDTTGSHSHKQNSNTWMNDSSSYDTRVGGSTGYYAGAALKSYYTSSAGSHSHTVTVNNSGTGDGGNMPPYITCYMWKRTS